VRNPTIAVLTGPQPVDGDSLLRADLSAIGATVIEADGPAAAARAVASASAAGRVALVDRRLVAHRHALRLAIEDPRWTATHCTGVLTVSGQARELLAGRLRALPDLTGHRVEGGSPAARLTAPRPLVPDDLAAGLAESVQLHEVSLPPGLVATLVDAPLAARKAAYADVAAVDDETVRLRRAVKSDDGLFTTLFVSSYSPYLARWCAKRGLTPNTVTVLSLLVALIGAAAAATGARAGYITAAVALYFSFVLDCTDGQVARYSLAFSRIGSWLDATFDRAKEYAVYAGLALGSARSGNDVWLLAAVAMALQTVRHHVDFAYHESRRDTAVAAQDPPARTATYWARRVVVLPIGERWALIALLTAFTNPRVTFSVLIAWGALAAAYTTVGRIVRARRSGDAPTGDAVAALFSMSDIFASAIAERRRLATALGWLIPPSYHALEYALAIAVAAQVHNAMPAAFAYLAAVIYHHYDTVYRIRADAPAPRWLTVAGCLGFEGRVAVLAVTGLIVGGSAHRALIPTLVLLAAYLWALFAIESVRFWSRAAAPVLPAEI
jgi:phosphatidylglycerophosphate synthase